MGELLWSLNVTMPDERTRAILQAKDFLVDLLSAEQTPGVPETVRREARRLLRHFPGLMELDLAHRALPAFFGEVPRCSPASLSTPGRLGWGHRYSVIRWDASDNGSPMPAQGAVEAQGHPPRVVVDPEVMWGTPCLAGSRLPAATLVAMVNGGESWERLVDGWPWLTPQHVDAARAWLAAGGADT